MTGPPAARYVTIAYGAGESVYRQASMLLLSLLAFAPHPRPLVVVTDRPGRFQWFEGLVQLHPVSGEQIEVWQGPHAFSMRVKLEVARALAAGAGSSILLDADTLAVTDLSPMLAALDRGALFMHKREFDLGRSRRRGNRALWKTLKGRDYAGWRFRPDDGMWNSGVIGFRSDDLPLIDEALALYDAMGAAGIRYFATEQLVAGVVLGRTGRLHEAASYFTHYWGNKDRFDVAIARRLRDARDAALSPVAAAARLRDEPIDLPAESRPGRIEKVRRWLLARRR